MTAKRLYVIDAMALAFRSFFALGRTGLSTVEGIPTGAIYASAMFLNKLITEQKPDYFAIVSDADKKTFRHELFPAYKATRDKMPDDLARQLPLIFELFELFHAPAIKIPGVEADDVIGTIARKYAGRNLDVFIVSGDKDFMQLVNEHVFMYAPKKNEEALLIDVAGVREKFGCAPEQVIDALALIGDASDNVPGVAGIGEKGAAKLLETFGSLDGIYARIGEITAKKQRESLEANKADAYLSRTLVTLKTDVELPFDLEAMRTAPDAAANPSLKAFYERFEFKVLANKVTKALQKHVVGATQDSIRSITAEVGLTLGSAPEIAKSDDLESVAKKIRENGGFVYSVRASGWDVIADKAETIGLALPSGETFEVTLNEATRPLLTELFADSRLEKTGHGTKFHLQMLHNAKIELAGKHTDLKICDYLIDPNNYNHELDGLCIKYRTTEGGPEAALIQRLSRVIVPHIERLELSSVLYEIEMPLVQVLADLEQEGVYVDSEMLDRYSVELNEMSNRIERELYEAAGAEFNINSPKQLQELLFEKLRLQEAAGMRRLKKTKTGFSTDESVLSKLAEHHAVPRLILEYRTVSKIKNTYVDSLPQFINPRTQRIHASLSQTVAATGRLSCDRPNLQNIPMRTQLGRRIREAFKPQRAGYSLISADYSQVELRLLAHLANAQGMIEAFRGNLDVHTVTAAKIFSVAPDKVDSALRSRAKAVNFGIIYGMGPQRLAAETGVTITGAKDFIARYFEVYPDIKRYTTSLVERAREVGYTMTIKGRRRPLPEIYEANRAVQSRAENIAVNAPIQGSAADLIKLAMIRIHGEAKRKQLPLSMLLQVHDELLFCSPDESVASNIPLIRDAMEHAIQTSVPLRVDIRSGKTWLEAH